MELNPDAIANLIKSNPAFDQVIIDMADEYRRTTSMFIHELRNPLSLIKSSLQFIESKYPETKDFKYWGQLGELCEDMEHMMANASQMNTCNIIHKDTYDLIEIMEGIVESFMPQAKQRNIDLTIFIDPGCESYFHAYPCDMGRIKQVMNNLIKNAFEATEPGNFINIKLSYLPETAPALPKLSIQVSNNGHPIPEEEIHNIFLPFVTYKKGGSGIGLAVVKKIIESHYGSINVSSDEMLTCFTLLLPVPTE